MSIIVAILIFSFIVFIHELGHFLFAKRAGIKVLEFSIGMGPRLFSFDKGDTKYSLKILPLGGSCQMLGEDSEEESQEGSFNSKSAFDRFLVIAAGPAFNFVLAFIMAIIIVTAAGVDKPYVGEVIDGYPAKAAGLEVGDLILEVNSKEIHFYKEFLLFMHFNQEQPVNLKVARESNGESGIVELSIIPKYSEEYQRYMLGLSAGENIRLSSIFDIFKYSYYELLFNIKSVLLGLKQLVLGKISSSDVAGPIRFVSIVSEGVQESVSYGLKIVLLQVAYYILIISANLGIMNLLPIPALDGGRILFILVEAVTRKPLNRNLEGMIHLAAFVFLMILMFFMFYNDIKNIIIR